MFWSNRAFKLNTRDWLLRKKDDRFLESIRSLPCLACGRENETQAHHIRTRKNLGPDDAFNILPLCGDCHTMGKNAWHKVGSLTFLKIHPWVFEYMKQFGWSIEMDRLINTKHKIK